MGALRMPCPFFLRRGLRVEASSRTAASALMPGYRKSVADSNPAGILPVMVVRSPILLSREHQSARRRPRPFPSRPYVGPRAFPASIDLSPLNPHR